MNSVAFSSSSTWVVCGADDKKVTLMDAMSGNVRWQKDMDDWVRDTCDCSIVRLPAPPPCCAGLERMPR